MSNYSDYQDDLYDEDSSSYHPDADHEIASNTNHDADDSYKDDEMSIEHDPSDYLLAEYLYDDDKDIYEDDESWSDDYDDSMDGDAESAFGSCGWGVDEYYNPDCYYGEDF